MKLQDIKGIGPKKEEILGQMNIKSPLDLACYLPRYYEDRSEKTLLANAVDGQKQYFELEIKSVSRPYFYGRNKSITRLKAFDQTGQVNIIYYNDRFTPRSLKPGKTYKFFASYDREKNALVNPVSEKLEEDLIGGIYPIYSIKRGISKKEFIGFKDKVFDMGIKIGHDLPEKILKDHKLMSNEAMYRSLHRPDNFLELYKARMSLMVKEEVYEALANKLYFKQLNKGHIRFEDVDLDEALASLDFELTDSQKKSLDEIRKDMLADKRMNRIVIGDVGSGKTIVGILAAIIAIENGYQVAFMAPTELLAIQHFSNYKDFFSRLSIRAGLLTGSAKAGRRKEILKDLEEGRLDIVFGTHALFQDQVDFARLGLVITDEQQRFGVYQRKKLADKGLYPDLLSLSATPIPRTLALTLYRDLDLSIIEGLPKNRKPIDSFVVDLSMERRFLNFLYKQVKEGRQAYVIAPRVYDEDSEMTSLEYLYRKYKNYFKNSIRIAYIHGQMDTEEKNRIQDQFKKGEIDLLIATTIIEVGIDVENANLMIIYDANYFGLAQLHQLRGRVGRGSYKSYCIFVTSKGCEDASKLKFLEKSSDGFEIAQKDLELRGAGDRLGKSQSGFIDAIDLGIRDELVIKKAGPIIDQIMEEGLMEDPEIKTNIDRKLFEYKGVILN